jgi:hypothetical protein
MGDTQLPAEVVAAIKADADKVYNKLDDLAHEQDSYDFGLPMINREIGPIVEMLTEYATKLHEAQAQATLIANKGYEWEGKYYKEQEYNDTARTLLEKVIYRHEGGLLPDRFLYNEIKQFLDGK